MSLVCDLQCENWCKDGVDLLASQSISDTDNKGINNCTLQIVITGLCVFIGAADAMQKLNNFSKKFSMKQVTALKEMSTCLPEKNFKKSTNKLIDRCKQVKCT